MPAVQERLLALSRRARRALEKELQASHQQRGNSSAVLNNRSSGAHLRGDQGMSRDGLRPQEGMRADRRAGQGELVNARQKELSDRALRILEELSSLGRQVQISLLKAPGNNCIAAGQLKFGGCLMSNCTRCKHAAVSVLQWKSCCSGCAGLAVAVEAPVYCVHCLLPFRLGSAGSRVGVSTASCNANRACMCVICCYHVHVLCEATHGYLSVAGLFAAAT